MHLQRPFSYVSVLGVFTYPPPSSNRGVTRWHTHTHLPARSTWREDWFGFGVGFRFLGEDADLGLARGGHWYSALCVDAEGFVTGGSLVLCACVDAEGFRKRRALTVRILTGILETFREEDRVAWWSGVHAGGLHTYHLVVLVAMW